MIMFQNLMLIGYGFRMIAKLLRPRFVLSASALTDNTNLSLNNSHYHAQHHPQLFIINFYMTVQKTAKNDKC